MLKCPFCNEDIIDGMDVSNCYSCGTRWERYGVGRILETLEFDKTGRKWWWNKVDDGVMVIKANGVIKGVREDLSWDVV